MFGIVIPVVFFIVIYFIVIFIVVFRSSLPAALMLIAEYFKSLVNGDRCFAGFCFRIHTVYRKVFTRIILFFMRYGNTVFGLDCEISAPVVCLDPVYIGINQPGHSNIGIAVGGFGIGICTDLYSACAGLYISIDNRGNAVSFILAIQRYFNTVKIPGIDILRTDGYFPVCGIHVQTVFKALYIPQFSVYFAVGLVFGVISVKNDTGGTSEDIPGLQGCVAAFTPRCGVNTVAAPALNITDRHLDR